MIYKETDAEIQDYCRSRLSGVEHWLRRFIVQRIAPQGEDILAVKDDKGNMLIGGDIRRQIEKRIRKEPSRYPRSSDALLFDESIKIICNPQLWQRFQQGLKAAFPVGVEEARIFLNRLVEPRNRLAHSNTLSMHQMEQVLCYSSDVIESLRQYYREQGLNNEFNVPMIIKVTDSTGGSYVRSKLSEFNHGSVGLFMHSDPKYSFRCGDTFWIEVEIDPAFSSADYSIEWLITHHGSRLPPQTERKAVFVFNQNNVAMDTKIHCSVKSKQLWHRMASGLDDFFLLSIQVLPPFEKQT